MSGTGWGPKSAVGVLLTTLCVLGLIAAFVALINRPPRWEVDASIVVLPSKGLRPVAMTNYYEGLNEGQIVRTFAAIFALRSLHLKAADELGLSPSSADQLDISVTLRSGTAVLDLTTAAARPGDAEKMTAQVIKDAQSYVRDSSRQFTFEVISKVPQKAVPVPWWRSIPWDRWVESKLQ